VTWDEVITAVAAISGIASQATATRVLAVYLDGLRATGLAHPQST
jgi:hypothetical protein